MSLCAFPSFFSTPFRLFSSGRIKASNPDSSSIINPFDGCSHKIILFNSVTILSGETIFIRSAFLFIELNVDSSIINFNWAANLIALSILNGSSENVLSGSRGVLIILFFRSSVPLKGSRNCPNVSSLRLTASALIVKSLRNWSSSSVPFSTFGFLESLL